MISISFFVLLLTTYCYSVPVDPRFSTTTPSLLPTPGKPINTQVMSSEESTTIDHPVHGVRGIYSSEERLFSSSTFGPISEQHSSEETKGSFGKKPVKPIVSTSSEERSFSSSTIGPNSGFHSSAETNFENNLHKFHTSTIETKSHFEKKAIKSTGSGSSEEKPTDSTPVFPEINIEITVNKTYRSPSTSTMNTDADRSRESSNEKPTSSEKFDTTVGPKNMGVDKSQETSNEKPTSSEKFGKTTGPKNMGVDRSRENSNEQHTSGEKFGKTTGLLGNKPTFSSEDRSFEKHQQTIMNKPTTTSTETLIPVEIIKTEITVEKQPVVEKTMSDN